MYIMLNYMYGNGGDPQLGVLVLATRLLSAEVVTSGALPSSATPEQWIAWKELK